MGFSETYNYIMYELRDPRTENWFFVQGPTHMLLTISSYLFLIKIVLPKYMENRKPYDLKKIIAVYNIFQVIACTVLFWKILNAGWLTTIGMGCHNLDFSVTEENMRMARTVWWLYMLKNVELIETVFFVLRKKYNQVSFLHVYHHVSTFMLAWIGVRYVPGGMATFSAMPNSLVHILMYSYYLIALGGPEIQKKMMKWKQYLTIIQMIQFCIIIAHSMQVFLPNCNVPKFLAYIYIPNVFLVFYLFYDFYKKTYAPKVKSS